MGTARAAEGAVRWATHYTLPLGDSAIGWKRLTTDTVTYNGWCGGSAGMYFVLKELWQVTGNDDYWNLMLSTARGLTIAADWKCPGGGAYSASAGCPGGALPQAAWGYGIPSYNDYPEIVCHGVSSMLFVLFDAEAILLFAVASGLRGNPIGSLEVGVFVAFLALGLAYAWRKGVLTWR